MNDFERDAELDAVRALWKASADRAPETLEQEVMAAFRRQSGGIQGAFDGRFQRWRNWRLALAGAAIAALGVTGGIFLDRAMRPMPPVPAQKINDDGNRFVPVKQPRLVVISRGEQP